MRRYSSSLVPTARRGVATLSTPRHPDRRDAADDAVRALIGVASVFVVVAKIIRAVQDFQAVTA